LTCFGDFIGEGTHFGNGGEDEVGCLDEPEFRGELVYLCRWEGEECRMITYDTVEMETGSICSICQDMLFERVVTELERERIS
jgi:hypothetical protein